ncbi:hypothetical protein [Streptomyces sp. NPDC001536]|uniref:hypothetical protein n=1 Tax=Streptomyces sp. NPDC001536 TaxID=3364583 RepID=UPI0036C18100
MGAVIWSSMSSGVGHTCAPSCAWNIRVVSSAAQHSTSVPSGPNATANTALPGVSRLIWVPVASSITRADPA